jgi:hypothetical protein
MENQNELKWDYMPKSVIIIFLALVIIISSCGDKSKEGNMSNSNSEGLVDNKDTEETLFGKWQYEEMGITMNIEILENKTYIWSSAYGSFDGKWKEKNDTLFLNPNDNLQSKIILLNDKKGKLIEITDENIKYIFTKIN